jgi:hypothetical protein
VGETSLLRCASVLAFSHSCASRSCAPPVALRRQPSYRHLSSAHHSRGGYSAEEPQHLRRLKDGGVVMTVATASAALSIGCTPSCAALRPPGPSLCGGARVHTAAYVARLRRKCGVFLISHTSLDVSKQSGEVLLHLLNPPYPHPTGGVSDARHGCASRFSQHRQKPQSPKRRRSQRRPHPRVFAGQKPPVPL